MRCLPGPRQVKNSRKEELAGHGGPTSRPDAPWRTPPEDELGEEQLGREISCQKRRNKNNFRRIETPKLKAQTIAADRIGHGTPGSLGAPIIKMKSLQNHGSVSIVLLTLLRTLFSVDRVEQSCHPAILQSYNPREY